MRGGGISLVGISEILTEIAKHFCVQIDLTSRVFNIFCFRAVGAFPMTAEHTRSRDFGCPQRYIHIYIYISVTVSKDLVAGDPFSGSHLVIESSSPVFGKVSRLFDTYKSLFFSPGALGILETRRGISRYLDNKELPENRYVDLEL